MSKMDLSGKLSLYDFLTMLVCGFMILALFVPLPSEEHQWIILIIFSYLTGLIYHRILECIRAKICECKIFSSCQFLGTIFTSNNHCAIQKAKDIIWEQNDLKSQKCNKEDLKAIQDEYYTVYYSIMDKPCYSNIKLLESQEAFLRNITWIIVLYAIFMCNCCNYCTCSIAKQCLLPYLNNCLHIFIASLFIVAIFVARYYTQMKIYKLVWEGYKYTHNKE